MEITTDQIIQLFKSDFGSRYKPYAKMKEHNYQIWNRFLTILQDADLMNKIIFANNIGEVPPAQAFFNLPQNQDLKSLDDHSKRFIGAGFAFIFKKIFNYKDQHKKSTNNIIKSAYWYSDNDEPVLVK